MWTENLYRRVRTFLSGQVERIDILCPFIQVGALDAILADSHWRSLSVITTWRIEDLVRGFSDHRIYPYLRDRGAQMLIHPRLHAKVFSRDLSKLIISTANISDAGLGDAAVSNIECAVRVARIPQPVVTWLTRVIAEALPVTDRLYADVCAQMEAAECTRMNRLEPVYARASALLASLLRTSSPDDLLSALGRQGLAASGRAIGMHPDVVHDLVLLGLSHAAPCDACRSGLVQPFFGIELVQKFIRRLDRNGCYFGEAKRWLRAECPAAAAYSREYLTQATRVLLTWSADLSSGRLSLLQPRHSQLLVANTTLVNFEFNETD